MTAVSFYLSSLQRQGHRQGQGAAGRLGPARPGQGAAVGGGPQDG